MRIGFTGVGFTAAFVVSYAIRPNYEVHSCSSSRRNARLNHAYLGLRKYSCRHARYKIASLHEVTDFTGPEGVRMDFTGPERVRRGSHGRIEARRRLRSLYLNSYHATDVFCRHDSTGVPSAGNHCPHCIRTPIFCGANSQRYAHDTHRLGHGP
jgi:hypothetical protein